MVSRDKLPPSEALLEKRSWAPLLAGIFGGCLAALPPVTRALAAGARFELFTLGPVLFCGLLGSVMVWVHSERSRKKAFYIGLGAPSLLLSADQTFGMVTKVANRDSHQVPAADASSSVSSSWLEALVPLAHAQPAPPPPEPPPPPTPETEARSVRIEFQGPPAPIRVDAILDSQKKEVLVGQDSSMVLPPGVERLEVEISGGSTASAPLPPQSGDVVLHITIQKSFLSRFLGNIGLTGFAASQEKVLVEAEAVPACIAGQFKCEGAQRMRCNPEGTSFVMLEMCVSEASCTPDHCMP